MKAFVVGFTFLFVAQFALAQPPPQQTEEQKRLMDRHKKVMIELTEKSPRTADNAVFGSAIYLLKRRDGIPFVEDRIIDYRKKNLTRAGNAILIHYLRAAVVEDIPDKMIPEFVAWLEKDKKNAAMSVFLMSHASEFGPRGNAFLPVLEWIRDNSSFDQPIQAASDAIRKMKQVGEQKRLTERHKKLMMDLDEKSPDGGNAAVSSASYLLKRRDGIPFVEDRLIDYRKKNLTRAWIAINENYSREVVVEDIPDKMIPHFVAMLEKEKKGTPQPLMSHAGEFGPRGTAFLPVLEWIRDNSPNDQVISKANDAITKIKN